MNGNQARQLFQSALEDRLAGDQLRDFEAALAQDPALCAEFEAFADARANVADMDAWLRKAGASATRQVPLVPAGVAERISRAAVARKRGRLVRLAVAAVATAAAAAIALVLFLPGDKPVQPSPETPSGWPRAAQGGVTMIEDAIYASAPLQELNPAPGVTLLVAGGSLLHPIRPGLALVEGEVTVRLASGARFEVHVGNHRVSAQAPAEFVVRVQADAFPDFPPPEDTRMHRPELLARFGALAFAFTVTAASGNVDIRAEGPVATLGPGQAQTFQAGPPPAPKPPEPPKPEDAFKHLDKNGDGKLDDKEADKKLIEDFDDNKDGTVDLDEFKAHFKPRPPQPGPKGPPTKPEDAFKHLDKNGDGKL
ncbi:MAG: EF-hand domain-containing protein, partial [Planctomycetes bacterium]|nr:EF-hand domain-containing protein [Planctomycetota bacterium]